MNGMRTRIQSEEHAKRNRNRLNMKGMMQAKGTPPTYYDPTGEPWWVPMFRPTVQALGWFGWVRQAVAAIHTYIKETFRGTKHVEYVAETNKHLRPSYQPRFFSIKTLPKNMSRQTQNR